MPAPAATMDPRELLLRTAHGRAPHPLEMYVKIESEREFHFYAGGLTFADFASLYEAELRPLDVLVYRIPPDLLNPNYWEPLTREGEDAVRAKMAGIITRAEGERTLLWRADRVAPGRLLRDGLDISVELLSGYVFRTSGENLVKLGRAWGGRGRFEWVGLTLPPQAELPLETLTVSHNDLAQMRRTLPEEAFLFASQDDDATRVIFSRRDHLRRSIRALLRGFAHGATHRYFGTPSDLVCDQAAAVCDGLGFSASADRDVVDKVRTVEVNAWLGRTPWGVHTRPGHIPPVGDEKAFFYYDVVNGLWAVAS